MHPFHSPLGFCSGLPGWAGTRKVNQSVFTGARDSKWQWHQLGHMQICTLTQTHNHASIPPLTFYRPVAQPTASKHWRLVKALYSVQLFKNKNTFVTLEVILILAYAEMASDLAKGLPSKKFLGCYIKTFLQTQQQLFYDLCLGLPGWAGTKITFTHSHLSWSSTILCLFPPSTMIHSIITVQFTCLTVFLHNLTPTFFYKINAYSRV